MSLILYLAKPSFGGWVTFTSMLSKINNQPVIKITKRTEFTKGKPKYRDYGYGVSYRNMNIDDVILDDKKVLITAIDKKYHHLLEKLDLERTTIVIHDPTEIKSNHGFIIPFLKKMRVITIRKTMNEFLNNLDIKNKFIHHPYIRSCNSIDLENKRDAISISRIDYDKHLDIVLRANRLLENPIEIYGEKNDMCVYHKLLEYDSFNENDPNSSYRGRFDKDLDTLSKLLTGKKFMVDLSKIKNDGGGTQYTFLEALDYGCVLILNNAWVNVPNSVWIKGLNCFTVSNEEELADVLKNHTHVEINTIRENGKKLLANHIRTDNWLFT